MIDIASRTVAPNINMLLSLEVADCMDYLIYSIHVFIIIISFLYKINIKQTSIYIYISKHKCNNKEIKSITK